MFFYFSNFNCEISTSNAYPQIRWTFSERTWVAPSVTIVREGQVYGGVYTVKKKGSNKNPYRSRNELNTHESFIEVAKTYFSF